MFLIILRVACICVKMLRAVQGEDCGLCGQKIV